MRESHSPPTPSGASPNNGLPHVSPDALEEQQPDHLDNIIPSHGYDMLPVVGLGGSAGSIAALKDFFQHTPADTGLAYVVVLHLSPEHESTMPALLQRHTTMPVLAAKEAAKIEANTVYVIPPAKHLTATDGRLRLTNLQTERGTRVAVDLFFRSLAETHGPHAVAVVLSGADGDGAIGLRRIKERGGLTIAQDPAEAEHKGMPRSAIDTGMVDWVLPVAEMPRRIIAYRATEKRLTLPPEEGPQPAQQAPEPKPDQSEVLLTEVLSFLRTRTGCDFSYYKRATIVRRVSRRMQVNGVEDLSGYLSFLRTHPGEAGALKSDLLISVTNFFRDREAFTALEHFIPELFRHKGPNDSVRVWTPACATGEETYSMAMLLLDHARKIESPPTLQVFGCDLSEDAIQQARAGLYPATIAADVNEERLERYFVKESGRYRVRRELREMVLFATHDLLRDSPFSRMDLISCRNLLIYLNSDAKKRALETFHFSIRPGGWLFLGSSESVDEASPLFRSVDKKHRIYQRAGSQRVSLQVPTSPNAIQRAVHQHELLAHAHTHMPGRAFVANLPLPSAPAAISPDAAAPASELHFRLLGRFGPPSLVVNAQHDIVHLSDNAHRFLRLPEGEPTRNLLQLVHPSLRFELQTALLTAEESGRPVENFRRIVELPGGTKMVNLRVLPAGEMAPGFLLIMFETHEPGDPPTANGNTAAGPPAAEAVVQQLDRELSRVNANLRSTIEQYESSGEELKASNEELQAMNEELRSAGEELETSREEFQSVNEELSTVNSELRSRLDELHRTNGDLQNLMSSTQIATVFLDRALHVMRYTPTAVPLFHLIPGDVGRPITDLQQRLDYRELAADAGEVLRTLIPVEREVRGDGRWLLARVQPYRTMDDQIAGVVLTFVDITVRRLAVEALRESEEKYRTLFDSMDQGYCIIEMIYENGRPVDWLYVEVNRAFEKHYGLANATGRTMRSLAPTIEQKWMDIYGRIAATGESLRFEEDSPTLGGRSFDLYAFQVGKPEEHRVAVLFSDITERKRQEQRQAFLLKLSDTLRPLSDPLEIQRAAMCAIGEFLGLDRAMYAEVSPDGETMVVTDNYLSGRFPPFTGRFPLADYGSVFNKLREGEPLVVADVDLETELSESEKKNYRSIGATALVATPLIKGGRWVSNLVAHQGQPRRWTRGEVALLQETAERTWNSVERAQAEAATRASEKQFRRAIEEAPIPVIMHAEDGQVLQISKTWTELTGYTVEDIPTFDAWLDHAHGPGADEVRSHLLRLFRGEVRRMSVDFDVITRGSEIRSWTFSASAPGTLQDGRRFIVGMALDITERKRVQVALKASLEETERARAEAEAAGKAKDQFFAVLSHELRTPLTPILLAVEILSLSGELSAKSLDVIGMIGRNVRLEATIIDDLLDVTRIGRGRLELARQPLDLHAVIKSAIENSEPDLRSKSQRVTAKLNATKHQYTGDYSKLQQVVWNLLKNASKFSPEKSVIEVRTRDEAGAIVLEFIDSGVGIESEALSRIFEAFAQANESITREYGGLGLGLAIAKGIVDAHGGQLHAESAGPGRGATFSVRLPLNEE